LQSHRFAEKLTSSPSHLQQDESFDVLNSGVKTSKACLDNL